MNIIPLSENIISIQIQTRPQGYVTRIETTTRAVWSTKPTQKDAYKYLYEILADHIDFWYQMYTASCWSGTKRDIDNTSRIVLKLTVPEIIS